MPDIEFTDNAGNAIPGVPGQISVAGSLEKYLLTDVLGLSAGPDLVNIVGQNPSAAASAKPLQFQLTGQHEFQFGTKGSPQVDVTPKFQVTLDINAKAGADLLAQEPYGIQCKVPANTSYVGLTFKGSVDVGVKDTVTDITAAFDQSTGIAFQYFHAFATGAGETTIGPAIAETAKNFVIPANVSDLTLLNINDVAAVSGNGSLKLSAKLSVSFPATALASVDLPLPLNQGTIKIQDGVIGSLGVSFEAAGSYQILVQKTDAHTLLLSYGKDKSTNLTLTAGASASLTVKLGDKDLVASLVESVLPSGHTDTTSILKNAGLDDGEISTFAAAIKAGLDTSLAASINAAFSEIESDDAAFSYQIRLDQLDADSSQLVHDALAGDLSGLNDLEDTREADGTLAPGIKFVRSAIRQLSEQKFTMNINLLGILNYTSLSDFLTKSEVVTDSAGNTTINTTESGNRISGLSNNARDVALQKALFDSVVVTMAHAVSGKLSLQLCISAMHFVFNQHTKSANLKQYAVWFTAFGLKPPDVKLFSTGSISTCLIRTSYDKLRSFDLFLDSNGKAHPQTFYFDVMRQAIDSLLDPDDSEADKYRQAILENPALLQKLIDASTLSNQALLLSDEARVFIGAIHGDVFVVARWSSAMATLAKALEKYLTTGGDFEPIRKKFQSVLTTPLVEFGQPAGVLAISSAAGGQKYGRVWTNTQVYETAPLSKCTGT